MHLALSNLSRACRIYLELLQGAVRYFVLADRETLRVGVHQIWQEPDLVWQEFWWRERSSLLVAGALIDSGIELPAAFRLNLEQLLHAGAGRYQKLAQTWWGMCQNVTQPPIPLKGMWLTREIYPTVAGSPTRLFADIDCAVSAGAFPAIRDQLLADGYTMHRQRNWQIDFSKDTGQSQWEGLPVLDKPREIAPEVLEHGKRLRIVEVHVGDLDPFGFLRRPLMITTSEDASRHLIYICLHLVRSLFRHPIGLVDVALLLNHPRLDQDALLKDTHEYGAEWVLASTLGVVSAAFGIGIIPRFCAPLCRLAAFRLGQGKSGVLAGIEPMRFRDAGHLAWHASRSRLAYQQFAQQAYRAAKEHLAIVRR